MNSTTGKAIFFSVVLALIILCPACEKESNYRFKDKSATDTGSEAEEDDLMENYPSDGSLAFSENFQAWARDGYVNQVKNDCEDDLLTASIIMYRPDSPQKVTYPTCTVSYKLQDFAVNPVCGNKAGTSSATSGVSTGYVALQSEIYYECGGHNSDAQMVLSALPSVSKIEFSVSYGGDTDYVGGLSVWKKGTSDQVFVRVGDYKPSDPLEGEVFTIDINQTGVQLKFTPAISDKGIGVNDGVQSNRSVRIHHLTVWSMDAEP
ncbi:MAG: hypothetical protein QM786_11240 [Breznakibacter sp.]